MRRAVFKSEGLKILREKSLFFKGGMKARLNIQLYLLIIAIYCEIW